MAAYRKFQITPLKGDSFVLKASKMEITDGGSMICFYQSKALVGAFPSCNTLAAIAQSIDLSAEEAKNYVLVGGEGGFEGPPDSAEFDEDEFSEHPISTPMPR